jgi:pimeloyl-ACP methyl ester carboxylesterase
VAIIEIDGVRIAYDRFGEGVGGPKVIFLHAFPLNRMMWTPQLDVLRGNYDVVAPDMRGHGASEVTEGVITMERMADDVHGIVTELELGPVILVGLSMGGYVALEFARKYVGELSGLVLADTRATADSEEGRAARYTMIEEVAANGPAAVAESLLPKLLSKRCVEEDPTVLVEVRRMIETTSAAGIAGALAGMAERPDSTPVLSTIRVPTLVIVGEEDAITPPSDAEAMAAGIAGARLERIEGAAHISNLECHARFTSVLKDFLDHVAAEKAAE